MTSKRSTQMNARVSGLTLDQIDLICSTYGLTKTQVFILAIDRLCRDLNPDHGDIRAIAEAEILATEGLDPEGEITQG